MTPRKIPPKSVDWSRISNALAFESAHHQTIAATFATASLVSTYACRDIEPVLVYTGELVNSYNDRMAKTGQMITAILAPSNSKTDFSKTNYLRAYELGKLHLDLSRSISSKDVGWKGNSRVVINQQAFAFVLYTFAWQPIETMQAIHEIDPVTDKKAINDWLYFWNVAGYAMGLELQLLPKDFEHAKTLTFTLRKLQYRTVNEAPMKGMDTLLKNELTFLYAILLKDKPVNAETKAVVRGQLVLFISTSPGLSDALGLGKDPLARLNALDDH